jgi:hypothetical protein
MVEFRWYHYIRTVGGIGTLQFRELGDPALGLEAEENWSHWQDVPRVFERDGVDPHG